MGFISDRDTSVGIATRLWTGRPKNRGLITSRVRHFFLQHPRSASIQWSPETHFPEVTSGAWSWHLVFIWCRRYTSTPPYVFMAWWLIKHRDGVRLQLSAFRDIHHTTSAHTSWLQGQTACYINQRLLQAEKHRKTTPRFQSKHTKFLHTVIINLGRRPIGIIYKSVNWQT
jgi:hypothetical protein